MFNIENLYLAIGDQLEFLFGDVNWDELNGFGGKPARNLFLLAMVTIFQFAEDLPDQQAADAVRSRMDWKYALHLSLDYPGLDPAELNEFRQRLLLDRAGQSVFQCVLTRLAKTGLLGGKDKRQTDVANVLTMVNALSWMEKVAQAMALALEALASSQPDWLLANSLPHWYDRYDRTLATLPWRGRRETQDALAHAIGSDISYLLEAVAQADTHALALLPEIQALQKLWQQEFGSHSSET